MFIANKLLKDGQTLVMQYLLGGGKPCSFKTPPPKNQQTSIRPPGTMALRNDHHGSCSCIDFRGRFWCFFWLGFGVLVDHPYHSMDGLLTYILVDFLHGSYG